MERVIILFIMSVSLFAMPSLFSVVMPIAGVAEPGTLGALSLQFQALMNSMINLMSIFSYTGGIGFMIRGLIAFKEYVETDGRTYNYQEKKEQVIEMPKVKIQEIVASIDDKKIELLVEKIKIKSKDLMANPQISNEIELKHIAEKSVSVYLPKVIDAYVAIAPELRKNNVKDGLSAHDMACQQLELIHTGLCEIELKLLNKSYDRLKVSGNFLNQVFKKQAKIEKVIELEM